MGILIVAVSGFVIIKSLPGKNPERYAAEAARAEEAGEFDRAAKLYHRAYNVERVNPEYLVSAAAAALEDDSESPIGAALWFLSEAMTQDVHLKSAALLKTDICFDLAEVTGSAGDWVRVQAAAAELIAIDDASVRGHHALGVARLVLAVEDESKRDDGKESLKRALELDPSNVDVARRLARYYIERAKALGADGRRAPANEMLASADGVVAQTLAKCEAEKDFENLVDARLLHAEIEIQKARTRYRSETEKRRSGQESRRVLEELAQEDPDRIECYLQLADYFSSPTPDGGGDIETAGRYIDDARKILDDKVASGGNGGSEEAQAYFMLGGLYQRVGRGAELAALFKQGLEAIPFRRHFRSLAGNQFRGELHYRLCLMDLARAAASNGEERDEAFDRAEARLVEVRNEQGAESVLAQLISAQVLNTRGKHVEAIMVAESADKAAAGAVIADLKLLKGELYIRRRQWGSAEKALMSAMAGKPETRPRRAYWMLAQVLLQLDRPGEVIQLLKPIKSPALRKSLLSDRTATHLRMTAYRQLGQFELAEQENQRLAKLEQDAGVKGGDRRMRLRQATLLFGDGKYDEVEKILVHDPDGGSTALLEEETVEKGVVRLTLALYQSTDRMIEAHKLIDSLLEKDPENRDFRGFKLALDNQSADGLSEAEIEAFYQDEEDPFRRAALIAEWFGRRQDHEKMVKYLDEAESIQPDNAGIIERQFVAALQMKDLERAERYAAKHRDLNIDGTEGNISYGRLEVARGNLEQAIELMRAGLKTYPNFSLGHTYLAEVYAASGRLDDAKSRLRRALELDPSNGPANRLMGQIAERERDPAAEEKYTRLAARAMPNDAWVLKRLQLLDEARDPMRGIASREEIRAQEPDNIENLVYLARLYKDDQIKQYDQAAEAYRDALAAVRPESDLDQIQLTKEVALSFGSPGMELQAEGEQLLKDLLKSRDDLSDKALITMILARFYEQQGRRTTAERHIRVAVSFDSSAPTLIQAAEFFARTTDYRESIKFYDLATKASPEDPRAIHARIISLLFQLADMDRAAKEVQAFIAAHPDDPQGLIFQGTYHMLGGDMEKAEEAFQAELELRPRNAVALWQRGQLYALKGRWTPAIEDLTRAKAELPDGFKYRHRITLAECLLEAERGDDAVLELRSILSEAAAERDGDKRKAALDEAAVAEVASALVSIYLDPRVGRVADAEHLIHIHMSDNPNDERWPMRLGKLGDLTGNTEKAIEGYRRAAEVSQYRRPVMVALFQAIRRAGQPDEIIRYAEEVLSQRRLASMPRVLGALGWAYASSAEKARKLGSSDEEGLIQKSLAAYNQALAAASDFGGHARVIREMVDTFGKDQVRADLESHGPSDVHSRKILLQMLYMDGELEDAEPVARGILEHATADADREFAYMGLASLQSVDGRLEEAKKNYEAALRLNEDNAIVLNNLAYMLCEDMNRPAEALPYAERAAKLTPNMAEVQDTLGRTLARVGRGGEAERALLYALKLDRVHIGAMIHLGEVYRERGDRRDARRWLERARMTIQSAAPPPGQAASGGSGKYLPMIEKALKELES